MAHQIILCESLEHAYQFSKRLYDEECERLNTPKDNSDQPTQYLLGVDENVLSGQFGLHLPDQFINRVAQKYLNNTVVKTPLWINEKFIHGKPFLWAGSEFIGMVDPNEYRKILQGPFSEKVLKEARQSARQYSIEVQNRARKFIEEYLKTPKIQDKLMSEVQSDLFEEIVAEILVDKGFDVFLTPKTRDGGKDIIAAYSFEKEPVVMMVECKRRKTDATLGPVDFRALVGQFYYEKLQDSKINYGLLVTSAGKIGDTALNMSDKMNEVTVKDYNDLQQWISHYGQSKNGLWLPQQFSDFFH